MKMIEAKHTYYKYQIGVEGCYHPYGVNSMIFGPINYKRGKKTKNMKT